MTPFLLLATIAAAEPEVASGSTQPVAPTPVAAPQGMGISAPLAAAFADHLLQSGDPYNALTWYRFALFLDTLDPAAEANRFKIGLAYERGRRWDAAAYAYGQVGGALGSRALYRAGLAEHGAGRAEVGDGDFLGVALFDPDSVWADRAAYAAGLMALRRADLHAAHERFSTFSPGDEQLSARAASLAEATAEPMPHKSPLLAVSLSVVPGLGQLYAGHAGDAAMAFVFNAALGLWGGTLVADGLQEGRALELAAGGALCGVFAVTWSSNLVGAWRGAERTNLHEAQRRSEELLQNAWLPELELSSDEVALP